VPPEELSERVGVTGNVPPQQFSVGQLLADGGREGRRSAIGRTRLVPFRRSSRLDRA